MGLPFASTGFAALLRSVVALQLKSRKVRGEWRFFYEDVLEVCGHPHLRSAAGKECSALHDAITERNLYTLSHDDIAAIAPGLAFIFRAVEDAGQIGGVREYLLGLLDGLAELLGKASDKRDLWELKMREKLRDDTEEIASMMQTYGIEADERSYLVLFERTLLSLTINMAGTPLKGLQVMSVAETRALDFENVIILSMNERIFPQRSVVKTMIPNFLRRAYGMPPTDRAESDSAYYFYRLIGRAQRVALLYDSRDAGSGTGEVSRFVTQLRYLYPADRLTFRNTELGGTAPDKRVIEVKKTGLVAQRLNKFKAGGPHYLSASALKNFKHCGLKFYLQNVCRLSGEKDVTEFMDMASFGTIFHALAQKIYDDYRNLDINAAVLNGIRAHLKTRYTVEVEALINKIHYNRNNPHAPLPLEGEVMRDLMLDIAADMFSLEQQKWCSESVSYRYVEGEMKVAAPWTINPSLSINFKMVIDRVDSTRQGLRFIDYKTGRDKLELKFEDIFDPEEIHSDAVLQILAYCEAYASVIGYDGPIHPALYVFLDMIPNSAIRDIIIDKEPITDYRQISDRFLPLLQSLIQDIFDESKPFAQAPEGSHTCDYCMFAPMCGRVKAD
ncbi:MAG: PD-(D/E)XK nuclease family protein [Muribaculaceae bacterium]|nr:PD-(D/E)XK nuclease family protein [Muribaculaceae bacterium]